MQGLATVLTDQGMGDIVAFVPPAPPRPKAPPPQAVAEPELEPKVSLAAKIPRQVWLGSAAVLAVLLIAGLGYALVSVFSSSPKARSAAAPEKSLAPAPRGSVPKPPEEPQPASAPAALPVPAPALPQEAASASAAVPATPQSPVATQKPAAQRPQRPASESVLVQKPEWSSQVKSVGEVDADTERATMKIMDAIHAAQEKEREREKKPPPSPKQRGAHE